MNEDVYRPVKTIEGLECTYDGRFRLNGRNKKAVLYTTPRRSRATKYLVWMKDGKRYSMQASRCVALAWLTRYEEGDYITYRDGNPENIGADNLVLCDRKEYYEYLRRHSVHKADDIEKRKQKLRNVIEECSLTLHYFETKDMEPVNKHVTNYLYPCLMKYCIKTLYMSEIESKLIVPECIGRMYECIINGMCLYNHERYCKQLLLNYKKKGSFGITGIVPKPIEINVESLKLDSLWERYKVTKLRK